MAGKCEIIPSVLGIESNTPQFQGTAGTMLRSKHGIWTLLYPWCPRPHWGWAYKWLVHNICTNVLKFLQILVLDCIISWAGVVDELDFARRLHNWILKGFPDLGDTEGIVVSETVKQVKMDYHIHSYQSEPCSVLTGPTRSVGMHSDWHSGCCRFDPWSSHIHFSEIWSWNNFSVNHKFK